MLIKTCVLGCQISRNIRREPESWRMAETANWNTTVLICDSKHLRVVITPYDRCPCLRILDQVRVALVQTSYMPETAAQDVFISLFGRWAVRRAVRGYMADRVREQMRIREDEQLEI